MKKVVSLLLSLVVALSVAACSTPATSTDASSSTASSAASSSASSSVDATEAKPTTDRSGAAITLPDSVGTVISMAPSITETLVHLGCADSIIAIDVNSASAVEGLSADLPQFDMMAPDAEKMAALSPDVVFVSSMSTVDGQNPFQPLIDLGISVVSIPTSATIEDIHKDITFIGQVMGRNEEAAAINAELKSQLDEIAALAATVTEPKTVYFEIAPAPYAYSTSSGTYLNEMIELVGAKNILADQNAPEGWMSVDPEVVVEGNPDVIFTNVSYVDDPVNEILNREGWSEVNAVKNQQVFKVDTSASAQPNENIVTALWEMGTALYPEVFVKE